MNNSTRRLLTSVTRKIGGFFVSKKIFSRNFWKRGDFGCAFWPPLSKWVKGLIPNQENGSLSLVFWQLNKSFTKTLFLMILATLSGTPWLLHCRTARTPGISNRLPPVTAMTVRKIMILLYGTGGVPGRGEIPMIQISSLFLSDFPWAYCSARGAQNKYCPTG